MFSALPTTLFEAQVEIADLRLELTNLSQQQSEVEALQRNQTELADAFERWSQEFDQPEGGRLASRSHTSTAPWSVDHCADSDDVASRMGALTLATGSCPGYRSLGGDPSATVIRPLLLPTQSAGDLHSMLCEIAQLRLTLIHSFSPDWRNSLVARRQQLFEASSLDATCRFLGYVEGRGLALVLTDGAGAILHVNRAWERLCGYSLNEVRLGSAEDRGGEGSPSSWIVIRPQWWLTRSFRPSANTPPRHRSAATRRFSCRTPRRTQ